MQAHIINVKAASINNIIKIADKTKKTIEQKKFFLFEKSQDILMNVRLTFIINADNRVIIVKVGIFKY